MNDNKNKYDLYTVTVKYTGKTIFAKTTEIEMYNQYIQHFKKSADIVSKIAFEADRQGRMHIHFTGKIPKIINRKNTVCNYATSGKKWHVHMRKVENCCFYWNQYLKKELRTLDEEIKNNKKLIDDILIDENDKPNIIEDLNDPILQYL